MDTTLEEKGIEIGQRKSNSQKACNSQAINLNGRTWEAGDASRCKVATRHPYANHVGYSNKYRMTLWYLAYVETFRLFLKLLKREAAPSALRARLGCPTPQPRVSNRASSRAIDEAEKGASRRQSRRSEARARNSLNSNSDTARAIRSPSCAWRQWAL